MRNEILRQVVHFSGLLFIAFAQFIDKTAAGIIFLSIAVFFMLYSEHINRCEKNHRTLLSSIECRLRDFALLFERKDVKKPFTGAFWFYIGLGLAFLIFPLKIATAAGAVLAVSDSLSTIIGVRYGRHNLLGKKTWEGSLAFFITATGICSLFFSPFVSFAAALAATLAELSPEWNMVKSSKAAGIFNDNILIPLVTGVVLSLAIL